MKRSPTVYFALLFTAWIVTCCGLAAEASDTSVRPRDLATSPIARLAQAIEDGDAKTVAAYVRYPLEREAPLPPLENEEQFAAYFWTIFDEPFCQKMREGRFARDWQEVGCRGVMYDNGDIWVDGTLADGGMIYCVNYQSAPEKALREALLEMERATIAPGYSEMCDPVLCFETDDRTIAGRVDKEEDGDFRILLYDGFARTGRGIPRGENPTAVFHATRIYEGSGGNHVYLDRFGRYALDVAVVGLVEAPELQLFERATWMGAFEEGRPAHYANWPDLLSPPDTQATDEAAAE